MAWVALVGPEEEENLSLRYLASSLAAAGFDSKIVAFNASRELSRVLSKILSASDSPVVIGISLAFQWRAKDFLALMVALRERGFTGHITAGGHFGTFAYSELLADFPEIDSICRHEAERTIVSLTCAVASGAPLQGIPGLAYRDSQGGTLVSPVPDPKDLSGLAWPDRRGEPEECLGHGMAPIVGSRGCYASCAFCCIAAWHALAPTGKRFRTRPVAEIADEVAWLHKHRGIDIFTFHDDNFFLPDHRASLERINGLADALDARGVGRIGTVIKARPTDITPEIVRALHDRLCCIRAYLGIETHTEQGLKTLTRRVRTNDNNEAMRVMCEAGIYVCYNLLIFDPDTTVDDLAANLAFAEAHAEVPMNFGRVELYAGTPLLARMQAEGRCTGDYLGWDYRLSSPMMHRIFKLAIQCFYPRNFAPDALALSLQGVRVQVEVCRQFHADLSEGAWLTEAKELSSRLTLDSVNGLREIMAFVQEDGAGHQRDFVRDLSRRLRKTEEEVREAAQTLETTLGQTVGACCRPLRTMESSAASACPTAIPACETARGS
ncbi:MAG: B12-binding domain-containing radical SAM protein [Phycisphaerales bacterium]|nr:MAG: B12-binding domain-containing radical SAM protein [Phycisphaerales bacterium]